MESNKKYRILINIETGEAIISPSSAVLARALGVAGETFRGLEKRKERLRAAGFIYLEAVYLPPGSKPPEWISRDEMVGRLYAYDRKKRAERKKKREWHRRKDTFYWYDKRIRRAKNAE